MHRLHDGGPACVVHTLGPYMIIRRPQPANRRFKPTKPCSISATRHSEVVTLCSKDGTLCSKVVTLCSKAVMLCSKVVTLCSKVVTLSSKVVML